MDKKKEEVNKQLPAEELRILIARYESVSISRVLDFFTETRCAKNARNLKSVFEKEVGTEMDLCTTRMQEIIEETRKKVLADGFKNEAAGLEINKRLSLNPQVAEVNEEQKKILKKPIDLIFEKLTIRKEITERTDENGEEIFSSAWPKEKTVEFRGNSAVTDPYDCFMHLLIEDYFILEQDVIERKTNPGKGQNAA